MYCNEMNAFLLLLILWCQVTRGEDAAGPIVTNGTGPSGTYAPDGSGVAAKSAPSPKCQIKANDSLAYNQIKDLIERRTKLVNYKLIFPYYSYNPFRTNTTWTFQADHWARVANLHGQTLLSLAFNYGVMSLMTLTFGVASMTVNLNDTPSGCFGGLDERTKIDKLEDLLMRDFKESGNLTFKGDERVCHEVMQDEGGVAKFRNRCCFVDTVKHEPDCETILRNIWLTVIYLLLGFVRFSVLFCGPLFFVSTVLDNAMDNVPYVVKVKEPLERKLFLCRADTPVDVTYKCKLDLSRARGFHKLRASATKMPLGEIIHAHIPRYDILVNYRRLLPENSVPVGLLQCLGRAIFMCKMRNIAACKPCCDANMLKPYAKKEPDLSETLEPLTKTESDSNMLQPLTKKEPDLSDTLQPLTKKEPDLSDTLQPLAKKESDLSDTLQPLAKKEPDLSDTLQPLTKKEPDLTTRQPLAKKEPGWNKLQPHTKEESMTMLPWICLCSRVGRGLMVLLLPTPVIIRMLIYYLYEQQEVVERKAAADKMDLKVDFENSLVHFLGPTHPLFVFIYVVCTLAAMAVLYFSAYRGGHFKDILVAAFKDLKRMSWLKALHLTVSNMLWPFRRYGLMGCLVALVYWPFAIVVCLGVWAVYVLPTFYLTYRMLHHTRLATISSNKKRKSKYRVEKNADNTMDLFDMDNIEKKFCRQEEGTVREWREGDFKDAFNRHLSMQVAKVPRTPGTSSANRQKILEHTLVVVLLILAMYGTLILLSECMGFLVEVLVFTLMGIILNAGSMLKFITLIFLVIVYSYDCYNNVNKKYLKLNKSLFAEIKERINGLNDVTSLPEYLQENFGFKSVECSQQKEHEKPDDVVKEPHGHWMINDLLLFIDNEDMPRIPRQLFDEVCEISVAGAPGPVYRSLLKATNDFLKIVCFLFFVFLIVLSFGNMHEVNATNQSLATMAGGFLPLILRSFMAPKKPDIELGMCFKTKLDEIIQGFVQYWPMFDFPFTKAPPKKSEDGKADGAEGDDGDKKKDGDKDKDKKDEDKKDKDEDKKDKEKKDKEKKRQEEEDKAKDKKGTTEDNDRQPLVDDLDAWDGEEEKVLKKKDEEEEKYDVDILVHLPDVTEDWWLDQWSGNGIDQYENAFPMKALRSVNNNVA